MALLHGGEVMEFLLGIAVCLLLMASYDLRLIRHSLEGIDESLMESRR